MEIKCGYSYHIKNDFFKIVKDSNLMSNKENGNYRPHYYAIKDDKKDNIYWMIPISSKVDKYRKIFNKKVERYGKCNTIVLGEFSGSDAAYLLQNAFPITENYFDHIHTVNNMPVVIHKDIDTQLTILLKELFGLKERGITLFFADIDGIMKILEEN